jgi:hypothetical protein
MNNEKRVINPRDFQDVLTDIDGGRFHDLVSEALREIVQAVQDTNQKGSLDLKFNISCDRGNMVKIDASMKRSVPSPKTPMMLAYVDDAGNLSQEDPRQEKLPQVDVRRTVVKLETKDVRTGLRKRHAQPHSRDSQRQKSRC